MTIRIVELIAGIILLSENHPIIGILCIVESFLGHA